MYVRSLEIKDLRSIKSARLEFLSATDAPDNTRLRNVNVVLGTNSSGKSTVLRAIAMSVLAPVLEGNSGFVSDNFVRRHVTSTARRTAGGKAKVSTARKAMLQAELAIDSQDLAGATPGQSLAMQAEILRSQDHETLRWLPTAAQEVSRALQSAQVAGESSAFFLVGYGATRRVEPLRQVNFDERSKSRISRYQRVAGLFEEHYSLVPLSAWLPEQAQRNPGRHKQVITLLNRLLPAGCQMRTTASKTDHGPEYLFNLDGMDVPFRALSDGFRAYVGWIGDMLFHLCMGAPKGRKLVDNKGVVLVDEIDLHLHPEWQRRVLPALSAELPNVQFIVTTHSPLVVGSLQRQNIQLLDATQPKIGTVARSLPERVHGRSAGQILLSPYFGLDSTRSQDVASQLDQLRAQSQLGSKQAALEYLKLLSSGEL